MALSEVTLSWIFAVMVCLLRFGNNTFTPLFLDSLNPSDSVILNVSGSGHIDPVTVLPSGPSWERIDPFFCIWFSMGFDTLLLGTIVACIMLCAPSRITQTERNYPKLPLVLAGGSQALSALLFQFSTSGSRTAPFLYGALGYFYVPIAFTLRFLILRKRPTVVKLICAAVIVIAEFVSLIPTMFPQLESESARRTEGGATGVGRILWPLCFVSAGVPHAVWNVLLEKSVKDKKNASCSSTDLPDIRRMNMAYIMFFNFLGTFTATLLLFWVDLIPGFGLMPDINEFGNQLLFNIRCIFGVAPQCGFHQLFTGWGRMICKTSAFVSAGLLLRYGEGANLYAILAALMQPMRFIFFTLFDEQPFRWHPHATLSTWLSIVALAIMLPTVIIYTRSPERAGPQVTSTERKIRTDSDRSDNADENTSLVSDMDRNTQSPGNIQYSTDQSDREAAPLLTNQIGSSYGSTGWGSHINT